MNNILLKIRFSLLSKLGMLPKTSVVEEKEQQILDEYKSLKAIENSDEMKRFQDLHEFVHSDEFKQRKKEINSQKYEDTEAYKKEQRLNELSKDPLIKTYLKVKDSNELEHYNQMKNSTELNSFHELDSFFNSSALKDFKAELEEKRKAKKKAYHDTLKKYRKLQKKYKWFYDFHNSEELAFYEQFTNSGKLDDEQSKKDPEVKRFNKIANSSKLKRYNDVKDSKEIKDYEELHDYVNSAEFKNIPDEIEKLVYKNTQEYENQKEYEKLKKSKEIKDALKFENSKKYELYTTALASDKLKEYNELKDYVESDDFKKTKEYMNTKDKFKLSDEYKDLQEYKQLGNSDKIKWYYKHKDDKKFDFYKKWRNTFYDDFDKTELDNEKWLTQYYLGKKFLKEGYSQATDQQLFTNGENLNIGNSILTILTQKEEANGKIWHPRFGFYPTKFQYTSGLINTAESFRQQYGIFRAKIKIDNGYPLKHGFWMVPDRISPEIDIFSFDKKSPRKVNLNNYWGEFNAQEKVGIEKSTLSGPDFSNDYYIFSLEWKPGQLLWKINGITVKKTTKGVPEEPLYMIINSGVQADTDEDKLPGKMHIDWVEAYQEN